MHIRIRKAQGAGVGAIIASLVWAIIAAVSPGRAGASEPARGVPWPATDALGSLPIAGERGVPAPRADRYVGMFYFLWHNNPRGKPLPGHGPYDISRILAREPDALWRSDSPLWGPIGMYHYWAEPLHGYYSSDDPWLLHRLPSSARRPESTS